MAEKRATPRTAVAEKAGAANVNGALGRFADRIEKSNAGLAQIMQDSLEFLGRVLKDDQGNRRFWRWLLILAMVLNFGFLGALGYNAIEGARARAKLVDRSAEQGELLRKVSQTLAIVESVTGPDAQKRQATGTSAVLLKANCDNQRNIARAMVQLGHPDYQLTEECQ